jgi:hypothetical protein
MENPLLYPFAAICIIFALVFGVWGYFTIKEYRRRKNQTPHEQASEAVFKFLTAKREPIQSAPMYRHRGHPHAAKRRGKNRADFRRYVFKLLKIAEGQS